jgi:hypothetical protein
MDRLQKSLLSIEEWTGRGKRHASLVAPFADAFVKRRGLGQTHAVYDFLFTYYSCSPAKLKQWVPSFEEELVVTPELLGEYPWLKEYWFSLEGDVLFLDTKRLQDNVRGLAEFIATLCENVLQRAPRFGCFGLHEWAMVYKMSPDDVRHKGCRLRLSPDEIANFVEGQALCCSHYDAYRFFTEEARPLNTLNPRLETRLEMEQGGCLHANMDIYKWATKLWPWVGSDFLAKAFFLALEGRELDMRASPYDLRNLGYEPICIETEEGRREYQSKQQLYAERSVALRRDLGGFCRRLLQPRSGSLTTISKQDT